MTRVTIGVDPGHGGALAVCVNRSLYAVVDMPLEIVSKPGAKRTKRQVDISAVDRILGEWGRLCDPHATPTYVIERVTASPGMGSVSAFTFGEGYGRLVAAAACRGWVLEVVPANIWKPALGLSPDKGESRAMASAIWPEWADEFKRKRDDGRAEAALLCRWHDSHRAGNGGTE